MEEKSVFEILDFVLDHEKTKYTSKGILFHYESAEESIHNVIRHVLDLLNEGQEINLHDSAIFSAYFGIPREKEKRLSWEKLPFCEKVTNIRNIFSEGRYTSFTKIL